MAPVAPALATFLVTGGAVAAMAQPLQAPRLWHVAAPERVATRPATIRIVLPPPVRMAPAQAPRTVGRMQAALSRPEASGRSATHAEGHRSSTDGGRNSGQGIEVKAGLATAEVRDVTAHSPAIRDVSVSPVPVAIPMVDDETRAALAPTDRMASLPDHTTAAPAMEVSTASLADDRWPRDLAAAVPNGSQLLAVDDQERAGRGRPAVSFKVAALVDGVRAGPVSLLIRDGENISVRLADLLGALKPAIDPGLYERLAGSRAARSYVTLNDLRAAGIAVRFDDDDRLLLGSP